MSKFLATAVLFAFSLNANALSGGTHGVETIDVADRLTGLGHTVTQSYANWWGGDWDYSPYDVVAIQYGSNDVGVPYGTTEFNESNSGGINNLLSAVQNNEVGVVFFRGWGANNSAAALGITGLDENGVADSLDWQHATLNGNSKLDIVDNGHYITQGMNLGINDLGYSYMSEITHLGANTTALANGFEGAALVVHNELRIVATPFYGHEAGWDDETALGIQLTENSLQWASGATALIPVPVPAAVLLFGSALIALFRAGRRENGVI